MRKRVTIIITCMLFSFIIIGCKGKKEEAATINKNSSEVEAEATNTVEADAEANETAEEEATETDPTKATEATSAETDDLKEKAGYKDGTYEYQTEPDGEGYYTKGSLTITEGKISDVQWIIYDLNGRAFDESYEQVFAGNDLYMQQSRDDWSGSRGYSDALIEKQDVDEVDAVSGATWTNRKYKEFVRLALAEAAK